MKRVVVLLGLVALLTGCTFKFPDVGSVFKGKEEVVVTTEPAIEAPVVEIDLFKGQLDNFVDPFPLKILEEGVQPAFEFVDESSADASLSDFVKKIKIATKERNKDKLLSLLSDNVTYISSVTGSKTGFIRYWDFDQQTENKEIWLALQKILVWGGQADGAEQFVIPSLFKKYPDKEMVIESHVNMRSEPEVGTTIVNQYSYAFLTVTNVKTGKTYDLDGVTYPWIGVKAEDGSEGYMVSAFVYGLDDYHLTIKKVDGQWKIIAFMKNKV